MVNKERYISIPDSKVPPPPELWKSKNLFLGEVVSPEPDFLGRIQVKVNAIDGDTANKNIPYAFPLMPKMSNIMPKQGEAVFVFIIDESIEPKKNYSPDFIGPLPDNVHENFKCNRLYCGPIISNPSDFYKNIYSEGTSSFNNKTKIGKKTILCDETGRHFQYDDIAFIGRSQRNKIILREEGVLRNDKTGTVSGILLHLGHEDAVLEPVKGGPYLLSSINSGYFEIKQHFNSNTEQIVTYSTVISDKINLFTHSGNHPDSKPISEFASGGDGSNKLLLKTKDIEKINNEIITKAPDGRDVGVQYIDVGNSFSLVRGEVLINIIKDLYNYINEHIHNYPSNPPSNGGNGNIIKPLSEKINDLENTLINKNIRIN